MQLWPVAAILVFLPCGLIAGEYVRKGNALVEDDGNEISIVWLGDGDVKEYKEGRHNINLSRNEGHVNGTFSGYNIKCLYSHENKYCVLFETESSLILFRNDGIGYVTPYDGRSECQIKNNKILFPGTIEPKKNLFPGLRH